MVEARKESVSENEEESQRMEVNEAERERNVDAWMREKIQMHQER